MSEHPPGPTTAKEAMTRLMLGELDGLASRMEALAKQIQETERTAPIKLEELARSQAKATAAVASMVATGAMTEVVNKLSKKLDSIKKFMLTCLVGVAVLIALQLVVLVKLLQ